MITEDYDINFDFTGDNGRLRVALLAEVEGRLKKAGGQWVHPDSGKTSDLSVSVRQAIDSQELPEKQKGMG